MSLINFELETFRDAIEHVIDVFVGQDADPRAFRMARRAVIEAYRDLPSQRWWHYYSRVWPFATVASQTTGTVVYDHTGGAHERMVTLTDATWPDEARHYALLIGRVRYEIEDRKSSTIITLAEHSNPGADLASTTYTLYRDTFLLPDYFSKLGRVVDVTSGCRVLSHVNHDELMVHNNAVLTTGSPHLYSLIKPPHYAGGSAIILAPSPTTARNYAAVIQAKGRPLKVEKEYTGTVTIVAGASTAAGSGTAFTADMVGAILRVSSDVGQLPTGPMGNIEASELDNLYAEQFVVKSVNAASGAAALTLESAAVNAYTATKYTVSDRLDFESGAMLTYFLRLCEARYSRMIGREDRREREQRAIEAMQEAAAADNRNFAKRETYHGRLGLHDLATSVNFN